MFNIQEDFINPTNKAIQRANPMPDDLYHFDKIITKKVSSYRQIIPSTDLSVDDYNLFLVFASPQELEKDIITEETYKKIIRNTKWD